MTPAPLTAPADAQSPDADRASPDAPLPEWVVHLLTLLILLLIHLTRAARSRSIALPSWLHDRPDLPPGSAQALAASIRGEFGNGVAWMCRRAGIGPGHPDWPYLSRTIVAFGGSTKGFRPGLPACGLQWWENPDILPGMIGGAPARPAAEALASLLSRQAVAHARPPAPNVEPAAARPAPSPAIRQPVRAAAGPPTGPPATCGRYQPLMFSKRSQPMAGPAVLIRADRNTCLA